jgi:hypothetical protein
MDIFVFFYMINIGFILKCLSPAHFMSYGTKTEKVILVFIGCYKLQSSIRGQNHLTKMHRLRLFEPKNIWKEGDPSEALIKTTKLHENCRLALTVSFHVGEL